MEIVRLSVRSHDFPDGLAGESDWRSAGTAKEGHGDQRAQSNYSYITNYYFECIPDEVFVQLFSHFHSLPVSRPLVLSCFSLSLSLSLSLSITAQSMSKKFMLCSPKRQLTV